MLLETFIMKELINNNIEKFSDAAAAGWTIIGIYIAVNSSLMDKSMIDSTTFGLTYLICCIALLSGAYIVQFMSN